MKQLRITLLLLVIQFGFLVMFLNGFDIPEPLFKVHPKYCTFPCETKACIHPKHFEFVQPIMAAQVIVLKALPLPYDVANMIVYGAIIIWILYTVFRAILPRKKSWILFAINVLLLILTIPCFFPEMLKSFFLGAVITFLQISWSLETSVIDVYRVVFGMLLPITGLICGIYWFRVIRTGDPLRLPK